MKDYIESAKSGKKRVGQRLLIKHLQGETITRGQSIKAKCYDCMGMGEQKSCKMPHCPLYKYSPCK